MRLKNVWILCVKSLYLDFTHKNLMLILMNSKNWVILTWRWLIASNVLAVNRVVVDIHWCPDSDYPVIVAYCYLASSIMI